MGVSDWLSPTPKQENLSCFSHAHGQLLPAPASKDQKRRQRAAAAGGDNLVLLEAHVLGIRSHELLEFALGAQPESHPAALIAPRHQPHVEQNPVIVVFALRALVLPCDVSDAQELELLPLSERFAGIERIAIPCSLALKKRVTLWRRRLSRVGLLHRLRSRSPSDHS